MLGKLKVSSLGLGCMGMSEFYGTTNHAESIQTIRKAYDDGITFFDTADVYGFGENERLIAEALGHVRDKVVIATKCGIVRDKTNPMVRGVNGKPDYIKKACEESLQRLGTSYIDLFYLHRVDPATPIEESMTAMAELVKEGKIRHIGLSEVDAATIRKAHAIHPITAIQTEYSLWSRGPENDVIPTCRELNIGFVPYSPLGRGFLTGKIKSVGLFEQTDVRRYLPRFEEGNFKSNLEIVTGIEEMAKRKNCTPAQLALAWVLAQGNDIVPIPGTKRIQYLEENIASTNVKLDESDLEFFNNIAPVNIAKGERYAEATMKAFNLGQ